MNLNCSIAPLGDSALVIQFENVINEEINKKVSALYAAVKRSSLHGVKDVVPAYNSLALHYDVSAIKKIAANKTAFEIVQEQVQCLLQQNVIVDLPPVREIRIPVCYSERYAPDLNEISIQMKISVEEIIELHKKKKYRVFMIGFLPGFAYMGEVDEKIAVPRKLQPRTKVAAGSVGIAGKQTGIYPLTSPGGWQIIGRTPLQLFNKEMAMPVLFEPGDEVEFFSISEDEFKNYKSRNS